MEKEYSDGIASLNDIFVRKAAQDEHFFARFQTQRPTAPGARPELKITLGSLGGSRKVIRFWVKTFNFTDLNNKRKHMAVENLTWAEYFRMIKSAILSEEVYFSFGEIAAPAGSHMSMSSISQQQAQSLALEEAVDTNEARLKVFHTFHGRELFTTFEFLEENENESALATCMEYLIDQHRDYQTKKGSQPNSPAVPVANQDAFRAGATTNKRMAEANRKTLNFKRSGDLVNPRVQAPPAPLCRRYQPKRTRIGDTDDVSNAPQNPNRSTLSGTHDD